METLKELLSIGKQYFDNKQYAEAETYLKRILDKDGRFADVLNMLGVISHVEGKFSNAIDFFRDALSLNPNYTEAALNLAVLYNDLGEYGKAKELYAKLKGKPRSGSSKIEPVLKGKLSNLHADVGDIYRSIGLHKHAIDEYRKALELNPTYNDIRTKLGQTLREEGAFSESLKELKEVLKSNSTYGPALVQQGITYYTMGKTDDAKKSWRHALEKNPENEYARMYLRLCEAMPKTEPKDFKVSEPKQSKKPPKKK